MPPYVPPTEQLVLEVFVRDMARSRRFYEALGFTLTQDKGDFVAYEWEGHRLFLDERPDLPPPPAYPHPQANVRIMTPDVDALWRAAVALDAPVVAPIADRDYGLRDFTIADPDGFGLRFGAWLPAR